MKNNYIKQCKSKQEKNVINYSQMMDKKEGKEN